MAQKVLFKTLCISKPSSAKQQREITKCAWTEKGNPDGNCLSFHLELNAAHGKISAQPHTIVVFSIQKLNAQCIVGLCGNFTPLTYIALKLSLT